jgi:hypothetical protein
MMAGFDEAKFRAAAKAAGYSDDEINAELKGPAAPAPAAPAGSTPPIGMAAVPAIEEQFNKDFEEKKAALIRDQKAKEQEITTTSPFTLPGFLSSPVVTGAGLLAAGYGVGRYGPEIADKAKGAYKSIKERFISNPVEAPVRIEPIGFESFANMEPVDQPAVQAMDKLQRAEQLAEANRQLGIGGNQPVAPGPIARNALPMGAVNPAMFSSSAKAPEFDIPPATPFSSAPPGAPAPESSAGPNSSTTSIVNNTVKEMIDEVDNSSPEMRTTTGATSQTAPDTTNKPVPPVYPKAGTKFKSEANIPPGFVVRYDVGNVDRSLGNNLGLEHRANARDLFNQGKPFGQSADQNTAVSNLMKQYFQQLQSEIPETLLGRDARQAQKIPSEFGVFAKNTNFGRGVTVGGRAATIFAAADVANAAQQGNYGGAALQAADIATDYLPLVGQVKQALSPSSAGEGSTLSPQIVAQQKAYMDNLYRLGGGPLAQTEAGERFRRNEEMARRIGGRTGAAVPPQYRR